MNFFIAGTPKPQGRPRAVSMGKFTRVYSPITEWRETVVYHCAKQVEMGHKFEGKALIVTLIYFFNRPKNHYRTGKNFNLLKADAPEHHTNKPDLDNLDKAVLDAMQTAELIDDDSKIISLMSQKFWSMTHQGVNIEISEAN